ncbi:lipopolysaccharide biosynthesis protein [Psychrobacillus sp. FSL H8-0510]|uniref:lipopolysaccharide biosynthesis protein n=1 Tax=Psychrobacillus sp. FSL H8-0510 TaxID=2921394 RepID=UPI0030F4B73E
MKKKKFLIDSLLNIISAALPLLVLQLISYPLIARVVGGEEYGLIITLISVITVVSFPLGNVLNNIRLLRDEEYKEANEEGDFNPLLLGSSFVSILLIIYISFYIDSSLEILDFILLSLITVASLWKEYLIVTFRLVLNYKGILLNNIFMSLGYLIGSGIFLYLGNWQIIYFTGLLFSLIYILRHTSLHKEKFRFSNLFKITASKGLALYIANLLKNVLSYADKLILLPLLGPVTVAIYYSSTILGKIISMMINPVNSVILSYLVKVDNISLKNVIKMFSVSTIIGVFGYILTIWISPYFLGFFYKDWAEESLELVYITTATAIVGVLSTVLQPFNLRFNKISWQIYLSGIHLVVYVALCYYFFQIAGLKGFTFGVLMSTVFKLIMQLSIFLFNYRRKDTKETESIK